MDVPNRMQEKVGSVVREWCQVRPCGRGTRSEWKCSAETRGCEGRKKWGDERFCEEDPNGEVETCIRTQQHAVGYSTDAVQRDMGGTAWLRLAATKAIEGDK